MKTQSISNQNFNGQLIYVTKNGEKYTGDIAQRLPNGYNYFIRNIQRILRDEPFDIFVSRGNTHRKFNVHASNGQKSTDPIGVEFIKDSDSNGYKDISVLNTAIKYSIENFKKLNLPLK